MDGNRIRRLTASLVVVAGLLGVTTSPVAAACGDAPGPQVDWSGCDRQFFDLTDENLTGADLSNADLSYSVLFRTNLSDANLTGANLKDAFPVGAIFTNADLERANLIDADLVAANLNGADLRRANLTGADLDLSSIAKTNFVGANLTNTDFDGVTGADSAIFALPPVGVDDTAVVQSGRSLTLRVVANDDPADRNPRATMSYEVVSAPRNGRFNAPTGVYTPNPGFRGVDTFTYRPIDRIALKNAPANAATSVKGSTATVTVRVVDRVTLQPPFAGASGQRGDIVRLYVAAFNRSPDVAGFDFWLGRYQAGTSLEQIAASFLDSSEFLGDTSGLTDREFITILYHNIFIRDPDQAGMDYWLSELKAGTSRARMLVLFASGPEFKKLTGTS